LHETLQRWLRDSDHERVAAAVTATADAGPQDEMAAVREVFGDSFGELVSLFMLDTPKRIDGLRKSMDEQDQVMVGKFAHAMAGSCASIGAKTLSAMCRELEMENKQGIPADLEARIAAIEAEYVKAAAKLSSMLQSAPA
jgi:HPt (histidine-containing phosphotransfer) domain-containing protein